MFSIHKNSTTCVGSQRVRRNLNIALQEKNFPLLYQNWFQGALWSKKSLNVQSTGHLGICILGQVLHTFHPHCLCSHLWSVPGGKMCLSAYPQGRWGLKCTIKHLDPWLPLMAIMCAGPAEGRERYESDLSRWVMMWGNMGLIWMAMFSLCCYQINEAYTCCGTFWELNSPVGGCLDLVWILEMTSSFLKCLN